MVAFPYIELFLFKFNLQNSTKNLLFNITIDYNYFLSDLKSYIEYIQCRNTIKMFNEV